MSTYQDRNWAVSIGGTASSDIWKKTAGKRPVSSLLSRCSLNVEKILDALTMIIQIMSRIEE